MRPLPSVFPAVLLPLLLAACATPAPPVSGGHLSTAAVARADTASIPKPVQSDVSLPRPKAAPKVETYSVVVNNIPAQDLLFALARDAKLNVDIHPGITGTVSLNAIEQTLQQLLTRIAKQVDMRWELDGPNLIVTPDTPYLRNYVVDYVNILRKSSGTLSVSSQVGSSIASGSGSGGSSSGGSSGNNNSSTKIENETTNDFWKRLGDNIKEILRETDKKSPCASGTASEGVTSNKINSKSTQNSGATDKNGQEEAESSSDKNISQQSCDYEPAAYVIINPESGVISVRATSRQHEKVQEFIDQVVSRSKRQVLIEATVVEVNLSKTYQQGIDWSALHLGNTGFSLVQNSLATVSTPVVQLAYTDPNSSAGSFSAVVKLLEQFGNLKVLSSPKISVMNNQTAVLKVVDNRIYFNIKADVTPGTNGGQPIVAYTTTPNAIPVGLVISVMPQISESGSIILNVRPSITSVIDQIDDPNPALLNPCGAGVTNCSINAIPSKIPVVRTKEMESVIRIQDGNIAVMGGLIEDRIDNTDKVVPGISGIPLLGNLFKQRNDVSSKNELVIFLRPIIIKDPTIDGDYSAYRDHLPGPDFMTNLPGPHRHFEKGNTAP